MPDPRVLATAQRISAAQAAQDASRPKGSSTEATIVVADEQQMLGLLGFRDALLRQLEESLAADIHVRGNRITLRGDAGDVAFAERVVRELLTLQSSGSPITADAIRHSIGMLADGSADTESPSTVLGLNIVSRRGRTIRPKTLNQKRYVDAIDKHTITFGIGPAGTGKTYLAMAKAVQALQAKQVNRIILTRPAVEAGERLGYLPGTLNDKIDPYLRPLYDALHDMIDPESVPRLIAAGTIEVAPLAYMRGRAQPYTAAVATPEGFRSIGSLRVGDLVMGADGLPTPVLGVFPQGEKDVYRVTTQDGGSTLACGEHLWTVRTPEDKGRGRPWRVLQTSEMIGRTRRGHVHRFELPVVAPVEFEPREVPLDPYALGLLLGDGCITGKTAPAFSTADPELADALEEVLSGIHLRQSSGVDDVLVNAGRPYARGGTLANPVTEALRDLALDGTVSSTKFVPDQYLTNSSQVRLAVLQGLLDTDGGPVTQLGRTCRVQYSTISSRLRDDVVWLVRSLGGVAYWRTRPAARRRPGLVKGRPVPFNADAFVIDIRLPAGLSPFRLHRKAAKYEASGVGRPMRFIESIEPAGRMPTLCIQVAAEDSLYVTDDFVVTHNTLNDAFIVLDEAQNTTPEQMKMFLTRLGFGSKIVVTGDVTQIDLPGGQKSGLQVVRDILRNVKDLHFSYLTSTDVVRHRLVGAIVDAYESWQANNPEPADDGQRRRLTYSDNRRPGPRSEHRSRPPREVEGSENPA